jgi:hypothetical protein
MYGQAVFLAAQRHSSLKAPEAPIPGCRGTLSIYIDEDGDTRHQLQSYGHLQVSTRFYGA